MGGVDFQPTMRPAPRLWLIRSAGIALLFLAATYLIFGLLGKTDVGWLLPPKSRPHWPDLPLFSSREEKTEDGKGDEKIYTVPTQQLTAREMADLQAPLSTNAPAQAFRPAAR